MEENRKNLLEFLSYHDKKHLVKLEQRILQYYEDADHYDRYCDNSRTLWLQISPVSF